MLCFISKSGWIGGTGFGEALNCGFGLLLDGTEDSAQRARSMLWYVARFALDIEYR